MAFRFSTEIRLGEVLTAIAVVSGGIVVYGNFTSEMALIKSSQASQAQEMREVKGTVKEIAETARNVERRMDKAGM